MSIYENIMSIWAVYIIKVAVWMSIHTSYIYIYMYVRMNVYIHESWTIKKAECQRIDAFELWCWRRFLRVPWTANRSTQSIPKEISPEYSLEGLILKLKFQYFSHLMWRADSLEKTLRLGKIEDRRRRGYQRTRWLNGHKLGQTPGDGEEHRSLTCSKSMGSQRVGHNLVTEQQHIFLQLPGCLSG